MTVTTITYRRLCNTGDYENFAIEMTAAVGPDEQPADAAAALRDAGACGHPREIERRPNAWRNGWPDLFPREGAGIPGELG